MLEAVRRVVVGTIGALVISCAFFVSSSSASTTSSKPTIVVGAKGSKNKPVALSNRWKPIFSGAQGGRKGTFVLSTKSVIRWERSGGKSFVLTAMGKKNGVTIRSTGKPPKAGIFPKGSRLKVTTLKGSPGKLAVTEDVIILPAGKYLVTIKSDSKWKLVARPN